MPSIIVLFVHRPSSLLLLCTLKGVGGRRNFRNGWEFTERRVHVEWCNFRSRLVILKGVKRLTVTEGKAVLSVVVVDVYKIEFYAALVV